MITVRASRGMSHLLPLSRGELRLALSCMLETLGFPEYDLELALVSDAAMAALNEDFLGCHGPTNVLSFPAMPTVDETAWEGEEASLENEFFDRETVDDVDGDEDAVFPTILGELALAPQTVRREAFLYGQPLCRHTLWLLAHGMTHLAGHDHGPVMDALAEEAMQHATACLLEKGICNEDAL